MELEALGARIAEHGAVAFLVTVGGDGRPHVVSVTVAWDGWVLKAPVGATTAGNAAARPDVSLLWPAPPGAEYALIADGRAVVTDGADPSVTVAPSRAGLHRLAGATGDGPGCITVVSQQT